LRGLDNTAPLPKDAIEMADNTPIPGMTPLFRKVLNISNVILKIQNSMESFRNGAYSGHKKIAYSSYWHEF
jgi:hypothetical protein